MSLIQIDMFEVQLGAAILLQFQGDTGPVRVLADAGVKASGYPSDHVLTKLNSILPAGERRLDLVIGTHYDEDHLNGLVPIIDDDTIDIGEAWMPPVVNDAATYAIDQALTARDLLAHQFSGEDGGAILDDYLEAKRADIEILRRLEEALSGKERSTSDGLRGGPDRRRGYGEHDISFFREQIQDERGDLADHGVGEDVEPHPVVEEVISHLRRDQYSSRNFSPDLDYLLNRAAQIGRDRPEIAKAQILSVSGIRKSAAKDAINAKALHDVVQALGGRQIPIRSEIIDDGVPRLYRWSDAQRRFLVSKPAPGGITFTLLGPSKSLVRKHRERLPVLAAAFVALEFRGAIRSITPSNQLSYIGRFDFRDQRILITGDAGCVDFSKGRKGYDPRLLRELKPLHVIQVAHHGGNNAHFYRVLEAADFPGQHEHSFLLLSHAYLDKTRPSQVFHDFLMKMLDPAAADDKVRLLFTSEPEKIKVIDYLHVIYPRVEPRAKVGDVRLLYDHGAWTVSKHAVEIN